jgi:hypothetical protein
METKTKKMEWSKPALEELGRARLTLGICESGFGAGNQGRDDCKNGTSVRQNGVCQTGTSGLVAKNQIPK